MVEELKAIQWIDGELVLLDQTKLPNAVVYEEKKTVGDVWDAISTMKVRGAPAIGVTAAYGVYIGVRNSNEASTEGILKKIEVDTKYLATSRPTAVNLFWALDRMKQRAEELSDLDVGAFKEKMLDEAKLIHEEDMEINRMIGENLLTLLEDGYGLLTHCNAGALATTKYGTATAPMYLAKEKGWNFKVYADETRPRLQGSVLTALELHRAGIDVTVITDNMAATVMSQGKIQAVIVGCDRVAANGDTANKIGTLGVAILAKHYGIPFYVAAPTPTIDLLSKDGNDIPIEVRDRLEVIQQFGPYTAPKDVNVYNPAFDITPADLITAIVTENGIVRAPFEDGIYQLFGERLTDTKAEVE